MNNFFNKRTTQILSSIAIYFVIRIFSYYFQPEHIINTILSLIIVCVVGYLLLKRNNLGYYIISAEIILGGIGNFLSIDFLSLRTLLLLVCVTIFAINQFRDKSWRSLYYNNKTIVHIFIILFLVVFSAAIHGYYLGNNTTNIVSDLIPYLFLLYYFPLKELFLSSKFRFFILNIVIAAVLSNLIFVVFTFVMFSTHTFIIQDTFYKFFRDIAGGKITDLSDNFFRIVLDEHLLLIPLISFFVYKSIRCKDVLYKVTVIALSIILSINLSRIYILALLITLLVIFSIRYWKKYLIYSASTLLIFVLSFSLIHIAASSGKSMGWELFGSRIESITKPQIEQSSLSRMMLLPKIVEQIKQRPLFGHGLGSKVQVYSPVLKKNVSTRHLDWGYLEILVELGIIGLFIWLYFLLYISKKINIYTLTKDTALKPYLAIFVSLLLTTITAPALFHIFGFLMLIILLAKITTGDSYSSGAIIINDKKQIVIIENRKSNFFKGSWGFPKGHLEEGENKHQALKREVYEETGIKNFEIIKELSMYSRFMANNPQTGERKHIYMFLLKSNQKDLKPLDKDNPIAKWVDMDKVTDNLTYNIEKEYFNKIVIENKL